MTLVAWPTSGANSYVSRADADTYFGDALHSAEWDAASTTTKDKALVTATRMLDRQTWSGERTEADQDLEWPRTGVVDRYGDDLATDEVPQVVIDATCELAIALIGNAGIQTSLSGVSGAGVKSVGAGSARVEFTATSASAKEAQRLPVIVSELLRGLLGGPPLAATEDIGTDDCDSDFSTTEWDVRT